MRIPVAAISAGLVLTLVAAAVAQAPAPAPAPKVAPAPAPAPTATPPMDPTEPPDDAPMDIAMPKNMVVPSAGWADTDKTADSVRKATEKIALVQKAYQAAPQMTDTAKLTTKLPDGEAHDSIEMSFGTGTDMLVKMGNNQIVAAGDTVYFVPDQPADKYLYRKIEGDVADTMTKLLPGFTLPAPNLALRHPAAGANLADAFGMGAVKGLVPVGFRQQDGMDEILLSGNGAEAAVVIDPKTNFVKSLNMIFTPEGAPPALKLGVEVGLSPNTDALKSPIAFVAGSRTGVTAIEQLFDSAASAPAGPAAGDVAPVATLAMLDGKTIDLASLNGKVVILDFWATWCGPCRKGLPLLQQFADEMKSNDKVVVYPVNVWEQSKGDELNKKVQEFWTKQNFTMTTLLDPEAKLITQYGFDGIPAFVIIGPDGKLVAKHTGYSPELVTTLKTEVAKALGTGK